MRSLIRRNRTPKADPAPSRWAWRLQRLMLTPGFRFGLRFGLPFTVALLAGAIYLGDDARRQSVFDTVAEARRAIEERPEFMVQVMAIDGATTETAEDIREILPIDFPASSFDLDLEHIRRTVAGLDPVKEATVRIRPGGILQIDVTPRVPVAIWRQADGLTLIDETGAHVSGIDRRSLRPDLPLVAGEGADKAVVEALELIEAAAPLGSRLRGVVRPAPLGCGAGPRSTRAFARIRCGPCAGAGDRAGKRAGRAVARRGAGGPAHRRAPDSQNERSRNTRNVAYPTNRDGQAVI